MRHSIIVIDILKEHIKPQINNDYIFLDWLRYDINVIQFRYFYIVNNKYYILEIYIK
jgi:hypothetical protein